MGGRLEGVPRQPDEALAARHAFGPAQPYFTQRTWDFFAEHLPGDRQTGADINTRDVKRR